MVAIVDDGAMVATRWDGASLAVAVQFPRGGDAPMHVDEARYVLGASSTRRAEFVAARDCARRALVAVDGPSGATILSGDGGEPIWPSGFVGSLSHCPSLAGAVVARAEDHIAVGIDIERDDAAAQIAPGVMSRSEAEHLRRLGALHWRARLFQAKEAVVKCAVALELPLGDPREVEVRIDPLSARFRGYLADGGADDFAFAGWFAKWGRWGIAICAARTDRDSTFGTSRA